MIATSDFRPLEPIAGEPDIDESYIRQRDPVVFQTFERFVEIVDEKSWDEFMPKGVSKERFSDFIEYYDRDVFEDAGIQIRKLAKSAEKLPPGQRVQQIARIFSYFKNPDKETVLTPWRVVNMHMSDTLGGWCFFNGDQESVGSDGRARTPAAPFSVLLDEPRFVDRGDPNWRIGGFNKRV